jgi:hypothetical protein
MKKRSANLLRLIHMHSKHIHRAPRWQVALAVVACAFLTKWAPAQTEVADTKPAATAGKSAQSVKTSKFDITQPVGDTYAAAPSLAIEQARVVIYRPRRTDEKAGVISVYLSTEFFAGAWFNEFKRVIPTPVTSVQGLNALSHASSLFFINMLEQVGLAAVC